MHVQHDMLTMSHWFETGPSVGAHERRDLPMEHNPTVQRLLQMRGAVEAASHYRKELQQASWRRASPQMLEMAATRVGVVDQAMLHSYDALVASASLAALADVDFADESHSEFFERIADAIAEIEGTWVNQTQEALRTYLEFFQEFSSIMADLKDAVSADTAEDREGYVKVDFTDLRAKLEAFIRKWEGKSLGVFASQEEAEAFLEDAGLLPMDFPITQTPQGYAIGLPVHVVIDLRNSMPGPPSSGPPVPPNRGDFPPGEAGSTLYSFALRDYTEALAAYQAALGPRSWNNAEYNAWLSGKDSYTERLQHNSSVLAERYSRVIQMYDNLVKVLSSTIESITDADKQFIHALA